MIHIVLIEPEIPSNTGNIVRTCVATNSVLHLVRPLGFDTSDKMLKRAGLDYWYDAQIVYHDSFDELRKLYSDAQFWFFTTKGQKTYSDVSYDKDTFLVFGKETHGIDEKILFENYEHAVRIPMYENNRSLNLSNSVAIAVYEVLRQRDFEGLNFKGKLTKY